MSWRYAFADLLTDRDLVNLELKGVSFDRRIIEPGTLEATVPIPNRATAERLEKVIEGRTVCHVYHDSDIWGTYIVWGLTPSSDAKGRLSAKLSGASLESWLWHRIVAADRDFTQVDQITIARTLLNDVTVGYAPYQAAAGIGLTLASGTSGVLRDRSYRVSEMTWVGQRLQELADVNNGFEWIIRTWVDTATNSRPRQWQWATLLGQTAAPWTFTQPGNVIQWEYPRSAVSAGTAHWSRGDAPQGAASPAQPVYVGPVPASDRLDAGWPWLDLTADHQGVTDTNTLMDYAIRWRDRQSGSLGVPVITVALNKTGITPNNIGDAGRLTLVNDLWPLDENRRPTFDHLWRVVGMEVTPGEGDSAGNDRARLVFADGLPYYPRTIVDVVNDTRRAAKAAYTQANTR